MFARVDSAIVDRSVRMKRRGTSAYRGSSSTVSKWNSVVSMTGPMPKSTSPLRTLSKMAVDVSSRTKISIPGFARSNFASARARRVAAIVGEQASETRPRRKSAASRMMRSPISISRIARRAHSSSCWPSAVRRTLRVVRWKSTTPSWDSSCRICALTADCERNDFSAAARKLLCSPTSRKVCRSLRLTLAKTSGAGGIVEGHRSLCGRIS